MRWAPDAHDRLFLVGPTGCGKTTLARSLAASWAGVPGWLVLWIDPKGERSLSEIPALPIGEIRRASGQYRVTVTPDVGAAEPVLEAVWRRVRDPLGNAYVHVLIDELPMVATDQKPGQFLRWIYGQGRAREIGCTALTQDPVRVPVCAHSQAEHRLAWQLRYAPYQDAMARACQQDTGAYRQLLACLADHECAIVSPDLGREPVRHRLRL